MAVASIGATGRDYSTIAAWESDTDNNLVSATEGETGQLYDDADFSHTSQPRMDGATTDATYFRTIEAASGQEYDPSSDTGVWLTCTGFAYLDVRDDYTQVRGFGNENTDIATSSTRRALVVANCTETLVERVFASIPEGGTGPRDAILIDGTYPNYLFNSIVVGPGSNALANYGVNGSNVGILRNCVAYNVNNSGNGRGFVTGISSPGPGCVNCISAGCGQLDYSAGSTHMTHCVSSDTTALGTGSITEEDPADLFTDPANGDFTLKAGSAAIDAGADLSSEFTTDFAGDTRSGTWDIGAYTYESAPETGSVAIPSGLRVQSVASVATPSGASAVEGRTVATPSGLGAVAPKSVSTPSGSRAVSAVSLAKPSGLATAVTASVAIASGVRSLESASLATPGGLSAVLARQVALPAGFAADVPVSTVSIPAGLAAVGEKSLEVPSGLRSVAGASLARPTGLRIRGTGTAVVSSGLSARGLSTVTIPGGLAATEGRSKSIPVGLRIWESGTVSLLAGLRPRTVESVAVPSGLVAIGLRTVALPAGVVVSLPDFEIVTSIWRIPTKDRTWNLPATQRRWITPERKEVWYTMATQQKAEEILVKAPWEEKIFTMSFAPELGEATIASVESTVIITPPDQLSILSAPSVSANGKEVQSKFAGGIDGARYLVEFRVNTSDGQKLSGYGECFVEETTL